MTFKEFILAFMDNAHWLFLGVAIPTAIMALIAFVVLTVGEVPNNEIARVKRVFRNLAFTSTFLWLLFCIPRSGDLWEVRVNLIKLNIASPDNIKQGVARVNEVAGEMECKYLDKCP